MAAGFRNFFLAFIICLLLFGYLGYAYAWPMVSDMVDFKGSNTVSEAPATESVDDTSRTSDVSNPENTSGRTASFVFLGKDSNGGIGSIIFARVNESTKHFIYCPIPLSTEIYNEVGVSVPVSYYFAEASINSIRSKVSALTGYDVNYVVRFGAEGVSALIGTLRNPYYQLSQSITCKNPAYSGVEFAPGTEPEDYYIVLSAGRLDLTDETAKLILDYGTENPLGGLTSSLYASLFVQFMTNSQTKGNIPNLSTLLNYVSSKDTNVTVESIRETRDIFFTYDEYTLMSVNYPSDWASAVAALRNADGTK